MDKKQDRPRREENRGRRPRPRRGARRASRIRWNRLIPSLVVLLLLCVGLVYGLYKGALWTYGAITGASQEIVQVGTNENPKVETISLFQQAEDKPIYILLVGKDASSPAQGDALFLLAVNLKQQSLDIIGIPSNTKIDNRNKTGADKINTFYSEGGIDLTKAVVEDLFHISIPYYIVMDTNGFNKIINVMGRPSLYVEKDMSHTDMLSGQEDIHLKKGYQELDPNHALQYMRYADTDQDVYSRVERQERFLKVMWKTVQDRMSLSNAWHIWRIWSSLESNISTWDAIKLLSKVVDMNGANIRFHILGGHKETIQDQSYWTMDPADGQRLIGIILGDISPTEVTLTPTVVTPLPSSGQEGTSSSADGPNEAVDTAIKGTSKRQNGSDISSNRTNRGENTPSNTGI